jgi:hypothetical protein
MQRVLRTYFERWRFRHPHARDFMDVVNEVSGQDLDWYFDQALHSNAVLDYSVSKVTTKRVKEPKGYDFTLTLSGEKLDSTEAEADDADDPDSGSTVAGRSDSAADSSGDDAGETKKQDTLYRSEVKIRRLGTFVFPVTVEVIFEDSTKVREQWDGRDAWMKFVYTRPSKLVSAEVDPDHSVPLDICFTNNSRTVEPEGTGVAKAGVRVLFWVQFLLEQPDFANLATLLGGVTPE